MLLSSTPKPEEDETELLPPVDGDAAGEEANVSKGVVAMAGALFPRSGLAQKGNTINGAKDMEKESAGDDDKIDSKIGENGTKSDGVAGERKAASGGEVIQGGEDTKHQNGGEKEEEKQGVSKKKPKFKAVLQAVKAAIGMDKKHARIGMYSLLPIGKSYLTDIATQQFQDVTAEVRALPIAQS